MNLVEECHLHPAEENELLIFTMLFQGPKDSLELFPTTFREGMLLNL